MSPSQPAVPMATAITPPAIQRPRLHLGDRALGIGGILAFVMLWELLPRTGIVSDTYLSPPSQVVDAIAQLARSGDLGKHVAASLQRSLSGLLMAEVLGVPQGLLMGWIQRLEAKVDPVLQL
ncbi:MAG: binding-protein-dependent transport system inner rane component family protein, partial [Rhodoferax sp.]|nr:binding-protein-dependent transport system inner rane component family protein [Rhodoferax sp.]